MNTIDLREASRASMPAIPRDAHLVRAALATWRGRMINEYSSSRVFDSLADQMQRAEFSDEDVRACREFADEERRHGVLCGSVVEALGGEALAPFRDEHSLPEHDDVSLHEAVLRNVMSVGCLSETVAVALIGAERIEMPDGELRDLLTSIWSDEVGHARLGWTILAREVPRLDDAARERLSDYLRVAFAHLEQHELMHLPQSFVTPKGGESLGLCSGGDARELFFDTVREAIIPRLEALGLTAEAAWRERPREDHSLSS